MVDKIKTGIMLNVLSLEDSVLDFEIICKKLINAGYTLNISRVESESEFTSSIRSNKYDIILADFRLPGFDAFGALQLRNEICPNVPFICVSGTVGEETAVELLKMGAVDYVLKDRLERLPFAIQRALNEATEKEARRKTEEALQKSEERFRHISNTISDISYSCKIYKNGTSSLDWMTGGAEKITGYSIEEIKTKNCWGKLVIEDDLDLFNRKVINLAPGSSDTCELRLYHKNCSIVWVNSFAECIEDSESSGCNRIFGGLIDITERKQIEKQIIQSNERYRQLFENSGTGVVIIDEEGKYILANKIAAANLGKTPDEIIGKSMFDLLPREQAEKYLEFNRQLIKVGGGREYEDSYILPGGKKYFLVVDQCIKDENGRNFAIQSSSIEITDRKEAENRLRESEVKFRSLFENSIMGISQAIADGHLIYANDAYAKMYGYKDSEDIMSKVSHVGQQLYDNPEDREEVIKILATKGVMAPREMAVKRRDGTRFYVLVSAREIHNSEGNFLYYQAEHVDITERKCAEEALRESEEKYRDMVEQINDVIFTTDKNGIFTYVSPTVEVMGGYQPVDMIGHSIGEFLDPMFLQLIKEQFQNVMTGILTPAEYRVKTKTGEFKWMRSSSRPIIVDNKPVGMRGVLTDITERKQAEEILKENEEKYRKLFEVESDALFLIDSLTGELVDFNSAASVLYGYSRDELRNLKNTDISAEPEETLRTMKEKQSYIPVRYHQKKDGTIFPVEITATDIILKTRQLRIAAVRDITERKQAEESLRQSEERYKLIFESASIAINITHSSEIIYANPSYLTMFGLSSLEELKGYAPLELFAPEWRPLILENIQRRAKNLPVPKSYEVECLRKDGSKFAVIMNLVRTTFSDGPATVGFIMDITERKLAEEALHESQERFWSAFEYAPVGVSLVKIDGSFLQVNIALSKMLGYSKEELLSKNFYDISHPDDREISKKIVEETLMNQGLLHGLEKRYIRKDGKIIWVEISSSLLRDEKKQPLYFIAQTVDITERKCTEEELIRAKEKAEESERLKTAFLHNISHEIRTPVNSIVGFADLLNEPDLLAENRKQFAEIIIQSSNNLLSIISDIINIATIEAGQAKINSTTIKLNSTLQLIHEQFFLKAKKLDIDLNLQPSFKENEDCILSDETKLIQIISNLIGNALKFTSKGFINFGYNVVETRHALSLSKQHALSLSKQHALSLSKQHALSLSKQHALSLPLPHALSLPQQHALSLQFFVEDTGIGIPPEMLEEIFTRFRQVENAATRQFGGSGLGLSISKAYVELLGGEMWLDSEVNKGSAFYFTIPYIKGKNAHN